MKWGCALLQLRHDALCALAEKHTNLVLRKEFFQFLRVLVDALLNCIIAAVHYYFGDCVPML